MRKRLVSILMALCMAVSLLPVQALAADDAYTVGRTPGRRSGSTAAAWFRRRTALR